MKKLPTFALLAIFVAILAIAGLRAPRLGMAGTLPSHPVSPTLSTADPAVTGLPNFLAPSIATTSNGPQQVAAADFNGDGKIDLAVTTSLGVDILLGNGNGTFQAPVTYPVLNSLGATAIALADMNNDGFLDLVVTTATSPSTVEILLGKGDGTFQAAASFTVGNQATALAVGDFNGDGNADVVVTQTGTNSVGVLLGNGDGTLQPVVSYATPGLKSPSSVGVGDFSNDGKLDLVVACGSVDLLIGNGDGTFQTAVQYAKTSGASQVAVADVNSDGNLDVVALNGSGLGTLLGQGNGTFSNMKTSPTNGLGGYFALGDMNGDGKLDAVVAGLGVMAGKGDGSFAAPKTFYTDGGFGGYLITTPLLTGGVLDVIQATTNPLTEGVVVWVNMAKGILRAPQTFTTSNFNTHLALGDFNNDGKIDVAALNLGDGTIPPSLDILLGNGNGTFQAPLASFSPIGTSAIAAGDFNKDGNLDLIVSNTTGEIVVFLGNGDGTFQSPTTFNAGFDPGEMTVADLNGDGNLDVAVLSPCVNSGNCSVGGVSILLGNGDGTFQSPVSYTVGAIPNSIVAADFNNDGFLDLAVANGGGSKSKGNVGVLLNNGNGTFKPPIVVAAGSNPEGIVAAYFNSDGNIDLAVTNGTVNTLSVMAGLGNGTFRAPKVTTGISASNVMVAADFNGDGKPDIAIGQNGVQVLISNGNGTFQTPLNLVQNSGVVSIAPAILGNDTLPDLVVGTLQQRSVTVITNATK